LQRKNRFVPAGTLAGSARERQSLRQTDRHDVATAVAIAGQPPRQRNKFKAIQWFDSNIRIPFRLARLRMLESKDL
jgi:hypothetical protein